MSIRHNLRRIAIFFLFRFGVIKAKADLAYFDPPYATEFSTTKNSTGNQLDNANIYRHLKTILKKENIHNANVHTFRHTCASHLVIKGVSLYIVKEILRHASIRETEIYAHLSKEAVGSAIKLLTLKTATFEHQKP